MAAPAPDLWASNAHAVDLDDGAFGLDLAADELEGLGDGDDVVHAGSDLQRLNFMPASAAHGGDDGSLGPACDVRLVSGFADALDHVIDFLLGGFL
jgi:hypothetical protein